MAEAQADVRLNSSRQSTVTFTAPGISSTITAALPPSIPSPAMPGSALPLGLGSNLITISVAGSVAINTGDARINVEYR